MAKNHFNDIRWDVVKERLENPYTDEVFYDEDLESDIVSLYLGSIFTLTPSGKYYTPFANSNVTEEEAKQDEIFWEMVETELDKINAWVQFGEGDSTDVYFCKIWEGKLKEEY